MNAERERIERGQQASWSNSQKEIWEYCLCWEIKKEKKRTFPAARPSRTMPSFKPETCEDVEDDEDEAPLALDAGKIFIFVKCVSTLSHCWQGNFIHFWHWQPKKRMARIVDDSSIHIQRMEDAHRNDISTCIPKVNQNLITSAKLNFFFGGWNYLLFFFAQIQISSYTTPLAVYI
jgi:hypothetical protein